MQSLDDSLSPGSLSPSVSIENVQSQLDSLRSDLAEREKELMTRGEELLSLREQVNRLQKEREEMKVETITLRDKLNVSEVSKQIIM